MNRDWRRAAVAVCVWSALGATAQAQFVDLRPGRATTQAGHITPADTGIAIAPRPPAPPVAESAPPRAFLEVARSAVLAGRTGETQEALERAETRLLDRASAPPVVRSAGADPAVLDIGVARRDLTIGDRAGAVRAIDDALAATSFAGHVEPFAAAPSPIAQVVPPPPASPLQRLPQPPPPAPPATFVLFPGHWQLRGAQYAWVPPDTRLRPTQYRPLMAGEYVWRNGQWNWVSAHYAAD